MRVHSSAVEHWIADPAVTGSTPVVPLILVGVVGNISACHADARGSIPRRGAFWSDPLRMQKHLLTTKRSTPTIPAWSPTAVLSWPNGA